MYKPHRGKCVACGMSNFPWGPVINLILIPSSSDESKTYLSRTLNIWNGSDNQICTVPNCFSGKWLSCWPKEAGVGSCSQRHLQKVEIKQHNLSLRLLANCFTSTGSFPFRLVAFQVGKYKRQFLSTKKKKKKYKRQFQFRHDTSRILLPKE